MVKITKSVKMKPEIIAKINHDRKQVSFSSYTNEIIEKHYVDREEAANGFVAVSMKEVMQK